MTDELSKQLGPWTVEWCCRGEQKGLFHVDTVGDHIKRNLRTYMGVHPAEHVSAWIILHIAPTQDEAHKFIESLREQPKGETK
jgi:hypothetical protein